MLTLDELTKLSVKELDQELNKAVKDLFKIRFEVNTGSSKANHEIRKLRKYRATIKTIKKQYEIEEKKDNEKFKSQKELKEK